MLDGSVIGECYPKHRHQEYLKCLKTINRETPKHLDLHLIVDNPGSDPFLHLSNRKSQNCGRHQRMLD